MKNSKKLLSNKNQSFLALLIRSYVLFSLITILFISSIFTLATFLLNDKDLAWQGLDISNYLPELQKQEYDRLPIKTIAGNGFVQIYDYNGNTIFSSDKTVKFTLGDIAFISDFNRRENIVIHEFQTNIGDTQYFIQITPNAKGFEGDNKYLILSDTLKILQTNMTLHKDRLTNKEFQIITHNANHEETLTKFDFKAKDGNSYTAIIYDTTHRQNTTPIYIVTISAILILVIYLILLSITIVYILKLIRDPLYKLEVGMYNYSIGNFNQKINYSGTKEFEDISNGFNQMIDNIEQKQNENKNLQDEKNRLLADLSHDLKTPITVIQGFSKALKDGIVAPEEQATYLQTIQDKSEHMANLINKMYDYSKLDHPDFTLKLEPIDIFEFTRQYFARIYSTFDINGFNIDIDIPDDTKILQIDKLEFSRVYDNIISNFEKYAPKGTTFKVQLYMKNNKVYIILGDNGTPIPDEYRENIFDAFAVADPARNNKGTGLGLAIIKKIVSLHGGNISLIQENDFKNLFEIVFNYVP